MLNDAAEEIASWGSYASPYFQEKHDLDGVVQRFRDAAEKYARPPTQAGKGLEPVASIAAETPRTSAALATTLANCGFLDAKTHGTLCGLARQLEREVNAHPPTSEWNDAKR